MYSVWRKYNNIMVGIWGGLTQIEFIGFRRYTIIVVVVILLLFVFIPFFLFSFLQLDQLHQQEALVTSLQQQLTKASESQVTRQPLSQDTDRSIVRQCETLQDTNAKLEEQLRESTMARGKLGEVRR